MTVMYLVIQMLQGENIQNKLIDTNVKMSVLFTDVHKFVCTIDLRIVETSRHCPQINYFPHHPGHKL